MKENSDDSTICSGRDTKKSNGDITDLRVTESTVATAIGKIEGNVTIQHIENPKVLEEVLILKKEVDGLKKIHQESNNIEVGFKTRCGLCGIETHKLFTCRSCGRQGVCKEYCYDGTRNQCLQCSFNQILSSSLSSSLAKEFIALHNDNLEHKVRIWSEQPSGVRHRDIEEIPDQEFSQYKIGDQIEANFKSSHSCYIWLYNIGPTGNVNKLLPSERCPSNYTEGGELNTYPRRGYKWILKPPIGEFETLKVFAIFLDLLAEEMICKLKNLSSAQFLEEIKNLDKEQWAEASCILIIH